MYVLLGFLAEAVFLKNCYAVYTKRTRNGVLSLKKCRRERVGDARLWAILNYNPFEIVLEVSRCAGIPPPEILVVPELPGNAKMVSICGKKILVCGLPLLRDCSPEEFEGVAAHEIGHVFSGKMRRFLIYGKLGLFPQIMCFPAYLGVAIMLKPTPETFWTIVPILFVLFAAFAIISGCSRFFGRREEFAADKTALDLTRYPLAFVSFLSRIDGKEVAHDYPAIQSAQYETLFRARNRFKEFLCDTHPPGWKRVAAAKKILEKRDTKKYPRKSPAS